MSIINPEVGAIPRYLWDVAQENIKALLQVVSDNQKAINTEYDFLVESDLFRPSIESLTENNYLANIYTSSVVSNESETNFNKTHIVTYNIDNYVQGFVENDPADLRLVPADEVAVARLKYQCAMVEYGLTSLATFYQGLSSGEIIPEKIDLTFNPIDNSAESGTPYAPARFQFVCKFPYDAQDLQNLPTLKITKANLTEWASQVLYT